MLDLGLQHKVVLIAGGSRGIGLSCAHAFAAQGARLALLGRNPAHLHGALDLLRLQGHSAMALLYDLSQPQQAQQALADLLSQCGRLDVLVCCLGGGAPTPLSELTPAHWQAALQEGFLPSIHLLQAALPLLVEAGGGAVVQVLGDGGHQPTPADGLPAAAAQAALLRANADLALAYAPHGVRVNAVVPGLANTERLLQRLQAQSRDSGRLVNELRGELGRALPMGRLAQPADVADAVLYLASSRAAYVNGVALGVDGAAALQRW